MKTILLALSFLLLSCSQDNLASSEQDSPVKQPHNKPTSKKTNIKAEYKTIEWTDLLPQTDLDALSNPPEYLLEIPDGSEEDMAMGQLKSTINAAADRYQQALVSQAVRREFNEQTIRLPGFIVPLEFNDEQIITSFFFVPFFGACIHQPPPPPNQIIYAQFEPGIRLDALYDPFWIEGTVFTTTVENELATASYSMDVASIKPYYDDN